MISTSNNKDRDTTYYENLVNFPLGYDRSYTDYDLNFMEHTFQADWTRPLRIYTRLTSVLNTYCATTIRRTYSNMEMQPRSTLISHI